MPVLRLPQEAREYMGLEQDDVAKTLGIPRSALSNIEAGTPGQMPSSSRGWRSLTRRPVAWFTGEYPAATSEVAKQVAHLARAAASLSQQDRQELARFVDFLKSCAKAKATPDGR